MQELPSYYNLESRRLRLLLKRYVTWLRARWAIQQNENYQGIAIPEQLADLLLEGGIDWDEAAEFRMGYPDNARIEKLTDTLAPLREEMPVGKLARAFGLTNFDCDLLILA